MTANKHTPVDVLASLDRQIEEARKRIPFMHPEGAESSEHQYEYDESSAVFVNLREVRAAVADLIDALSKIAKADPSEDGCYYTNRSNIGIAKRALSRVRGAA